MFKQIKHTLVAVGLVAATALSQAGIAVPPTPAIGAYNFSGFCLDCDLVPPNTQAIQVGTPATAKLTITDNNATWSFEYHSNLYDLLSQGVEVAGLGPTDPEGNAQSFILFGVDDQTWLFTSDLDGNWSLDNQTIQQTFNEDFGSAGVWAAANGVPEPATILMVALGLMVAARRRKAH